MATDHRLVRNQGEFRGLDKRSSDIDVDIAHATDIANVQFRTSGAINKRKGFHYASKSDDNSYGIFNYKKVNSVNGSSEDELLMVNKYLNKLVDTPLNITRDDTNLIGTLFDLDSLDYSENRSILDIQKESTHPDFATNADWQASFGTAQNPYILSIAAADAVLLENTTIFIGSEQTLLRVSKVTQEQIPDPTNPLYKVRVRKYELIGESAILKASILDTGSHTGHTVSVKQGGVQVQLSATGTEFEFTITDLNTDELLVNEKLGTGENSNDLTITQLKLIINSVFGLTCTNAYPVASPAAATLDITYESIDPGGTLSLKSLNWERIKNGMGVTYTGDPNPQPITIFGAYDRGNSSTKITDEDYLENASIVELNNVVYISNGFDHLMKYDGEQVYRAGLPEPASGTNFQQHATSSSGSSRKYFYGVMYTFQDAQGNQISSRLNYIEISRNNDIGNANYVDIKVPRLTDQDFCLKNTSGSANPNLKIKLFRTTEGAGLAGPFYEIDNVQNESNTPNTLYNTSTSSYTNTLTTTEVSDDDYYIFRDNYPDDAIDNLQTAYILPGSKTHDLPPKGKYLTTFKNCLVVAGQVGNVNNVSYSTGSSELINEIGSEYFPDADNQFIVESPVDTAITAIAPLRDLLYIFHANSIHVLAGDISDPNGIPYTIDLLSREASIGCVSNSSIVEFRNQLLFMSDEGVYTIDASSAIQELSLKIRPIFKEQNYSLKRTVATVWGDSQLILVNIPKEVTGTDIYVSEGNSLTVVYDYFRDAWLEWTTLDMSGGTDEHDGKVFYCTREQSRSRLATFNTSETRFDFADHVGQVEFKYDTNWESLGEPSVAKKFLRIKLYAFDNDETFESPKFSLTTVLQKDYFDSDLGGIDFTFGEKVLGYANSAWDNFNWGDTTESKRKSKLPTGKAYCLKVKFTNSNVNENVLLTKYELEVATPYRLEIKE